MKYTKLQKAGLHISKLGLGTNAVGGHNLYADVNEEEGKQLIEEAMGQGIPAIATRVGGVGALIHDGLFTVAGYAITTDRSIRCCCHDYRYERRGK